MGDYIGRTQAGKVFSCLRRYFSTVPVGTSFKLKQVKSPLLSLYQILFPESQVKEYTGLVDGVRTLASLPDGPLQHVGHGVYKVVREFRLKEDSAIFNRHYYKKAAKGKKYKILKEANKMKDAETNSPTKDDVAQLTKLGSHETKYQYDTPTPQVLETFTNKYPHRRYVTQFVFNEFTSLCPKTGQPDFATISVEYCANEKCIETKSLKLYFLAYRQYGSFMETITNKVLEDLVHVCSPHWMRVVSNFNARGGTLINVTAEYSEESGR